MTIEQPNLGNQGETCPECGSALAADQRYCLNCGFRRGEARVDYTTQVMRDGQPATAGGPAGATAANPQWTPVVAIFAIAVLGVMLLLGVLIGNGKGAAGAATVPGQGNVVQGGSGDTKGIATADTNASAQQNVKNGPDVVATQGAPEKLDPGGQAGGGSAATCIGC